MTTIKANLGSSELEAAPRRNRNGNSLICSAILLPRPVSIRRSPGGCRTSKAVPDLEPVSDLG